MEVDTAKERLVPPPAPAPAKVKLEAPSAPALPPAAAPPPPPAAPAAPAAPIPAGGMAAGMSTPAAPCTEAAGPGGLNGQWVEVHGLQSRPELNGLTGKVHSYDTAKQRYNIQLQGRSKCLALLPKSLRPIAGPGAGGPAGAAGAAAAAAAAVGAATAGGGGRAAPAASAPAATPPAPQSVLAAQPPSAPAPPPAASVPAVPIVVSDAAAVRAGGAAQPACKVEELDLAEVEAEAMQRKRPWTTQEDEMLHQLVAEHGTKSWALCAAQLSERSGKQCRERWHNHLDPEIKKEAWTAEEDRLIMQSVRDMGTKWSSIVKLLPGRSDNAIKNRYYSAIRKAHRQESRAHDAPPQQNESERAAKEAAQIAAVSRCGRS